MKPFAYLGRALQRARTRGIADTIAYSFAVADKTLRGVYIDLRYSGGLSGHRQPTIAVADCNPIAPSDYYSLRAIFTYVEVKPRDVLVDIGCGDGRTINYWLHRGFKNRIIGVEIDPPTAWRTRQRLKRFKNVSIIEADASSPPKGNLYYLYNTFSGDKMRAFEEALRDKRNVTIVVYNYIDISPFERDEWNVTIIGCEEDAEQYRAAIIKGAR